MMNFEPTRRGFLAGSSAFAVIASGTPTFALTEAEARRMINKAVADINTVINSGQSTSAMFRSFEKIFTTYADVPTIARSALGPPARSLSNSEMRAFSSAFAGYMARKYGKRFREFEGGTIEVTGARAVKSFQEVRAVAKVPGQSPFAVSFMVSDRSGSDKFFDLIVEGISLLKAERAEIGAMLDRRGGDVARLTNDLKSAG